MTRLLLVSTLCLALLPAIGGAQEPPPAPPEEAEESEQKLDSPTQEPETAEETGEEGQAEGEGEDEAGEEVERVLTPEEEEIRRKAAEKAAKREARQEKRAAKKAREESKRSEKAVRQELEKIERIAELIELGYASLDAGEFKNTRERFGKARELEGGRSFEADLGLAHLELALGNFAQAVQLAQRAVTATADREEKAEALTFAGNATLAARPLVDDDPDRPQPGTEMFADAALRFFLRAVELAPLGATEALAHLESRFPGGDPDARSARLLAQYFERVEGAEVRHGRRLAATYEALLSGRSQLGSPIAVVGPVSPPKRLSGQRPRLGTVQGASARRRLVVSFVIEPDGTVSAVEVISEIAAARSTAIAESLRGWIFEPARLPDGTPVAVFWLQAVSVAPE